MRTLKKIAAGLLAAALAVGLLTALGWCVFPFILPDCVKMALAILIAKRLPKRLIQRV